MIKSIKCRSCRVSKLDSEFHKSSLKKQDFVCKPCNSLRGKHWRMANQANLHVRYLYAKSSAKNTKKPFLLTEVEYVRIVSQPCFYCNSQMGDVSFGGGLDRINNDKTIGYTIDNVLPCCGICNRLRGYLLTVDETRVAVNAILKLRRSHLE